MTSVVTGTGGLGADLQPLVEGLSCSELSRLKALELLGGDGLWELELWRTDMKKLVNYLTQRGGR